jgi:hypothetical protein
MQFPFASLLIAVMPMYFEVLQLPLCACLWRPLTLTCHPMFFGDVRFSDSILEYTTNPMFPAKAACIARNERHYWPRLLSHIAHILIFCRSPTPRISWHTDASKTHYDACLIQS